MCGHVVIAFVSESIIIIITVDAVIIIIQFIFNDTNPSDFIGIIIHFKNKDD
jgi:hypothetical protein